MASRLLDAGYQLVVFDTSADATARWRHVAPALRLLRLTWLHWHRSCSSACRRRRSSRPSRSRRGADLRHGVRPSSTSRRPGRVWPGRWRRPRRERDHLRRLARQRRHRRRRQGHAGGHGGVPEGDLRRGRADPEELRQDVLHRRKGRTRADREARQQPARRRGHGRLVRGDGHGREGRPRPESAHRHHQRRQRPQQRHPGQVPAARCSRARSTSGSPPGSRTRTCGSASTRPKRSACRWWPAPPCARCSPITQAKFGADSDFTSIARVVEEWAGVEIKG